MVIVVLIRGSSGKVLRGLLLKTAASGVMSGSKAEDTHASASTVGVQKADTGLGPPKQYCCHKDISTCREAGSELFTMGYAYPHVSCMADTCAKLGREP